MSLRRRLMLAFAYVVLLVTVVLGVPLLASVSGRVDAEVRADASAQAYLIAARASGLVLQQQNRTELDRVLADSGRQVGGRVIVVDTAGTLVADSAGPQLRGDPYADRPEIAAALDGRVVQTTRSSETLQQDVIVTAVPVVAGGRQVGVVRVTQSTGAVRAEVRNDMLVLGGIAAGALTLGLAVAWLLARSLARPLGRLAAAARRVADGDLEARVTEEGSTEQQEVARAFNDMTRQLERSLRAQREFVANASHQLRTPLTGLRLRVESAALRAEDPALRRDLEIAEQEADRLARLLAGLLTLAREGERRPPLRAPTGLTDAVERALERWRPAAEAAGRTLSTEGAGEVAVAAPEEEVGIILDNLIENALRYAPAGTEVSVGWQRAGDHGVVWVRDRGPGVDPDEVERVFERFARGSAAAGTSGTGLGLAIVRTLARRWDGEASLTNDPAGGAIAEVRLPRHTAVQPTPDQDLGKPLPVDA